MFFKCLIFLDIKKVKIESIQILFYSSQFELARHVSLYNSGMNGIGLVNHIPIGFEVCSTR